MSRLDYWRKQAQEAEADFYRLNAEQDKEDQAITALVDLIHASRQVERLSDPELPYADFPTTYNEKDADE